MTASIQVTFNPRLPVITFAPTVAESSLSEREQGHGSGPSTRSAIWWGETARQHDPLTITGGGDRTLDLSTAAEGLSERLFDVLVNLKVAVSKYSMHIARAERDRLFSQLDDLLSDEDWDEEDELPRSESFLDFLKWAIFSRQYRFASFGLSDEGFILCAIKSDRTLITANFVGDGHVYWSARVCFEGEIELTAGKASLRYFAKQVKFFLEE